VIKVDDVTYTVKSQSAEDRDYAVKLHGQGLRWASCTCIDWMVGACSNGKGNSDGRGAPRTHHYSTPRCKHLLAVAMSPVYKATVKANGGHVE
jgi:hypothetical protein